MKIFILWYVMVLSLNITILRPAHPNSLNSHPKTLNIPLILSPSKDAPLGVEKRDYYHPTKNSYQDDISCCIADLKFDGENIYVCEFGEGIESRFKGYASLYESGAMWHNIWHALSTFQIPMHYVGTECSKKNSGFANASFKQNISIHTTTLQKFESRYQAKSKKHCSQELLVAHTIQHTDKPVLELQKKFPTLLFLGHATSRFVRSKQATNTLFNTPFLKQFKPPTLEIKKEYYPGLASSITQTIPGDFFVIKPPHCALGQGVILVSKAELDHVLNIIMENKNALKQKDDHKAYGYWEKDNSATIMIEAFKPSKTIIVENKPYDATLRAVFVISNLSGSMAIQHLGAYWKLPIKSLTDAGTFMDKHKSSISRSHNSSAIVDTDDYQQVCAQLNVLLPVLYEKMLEKTS